jgi:UDP-glucose 4-epimerase
VDYPVAEGPRRPGDPPALVADSSKARKILGWAPKYPKLEDIIGHAWAWHRKNPQGYGH